MQKLHKKHKMYAWFTNKGYGTQEHREAIHQYGTCCYHRKSFNIFRVPAISSSLVDQQE
jgi:ribonuclease HII